VLPSKLHLHCYSCTTWKLRSIKPFTTSCATLWLVSVILIMAEGRSPGHPHWLEDGETDEAEIVDQFLPDDAVNTNGHNTPPARQIIDVKLVNRLQGRPFRASSRHWQGTTGQMLAEIARALNLGVYQLYSLEVTEVYIYGFVKMEGSRDEMRAAHPKNTPTFPECM
jgi:hypothetical protein